MLVGDGISGGSDGQYETRQRATLTPALVCVPLVPTAPPFSQNHHTILLSMWRTPSRRLFRRNCGKICHDIPLYIHQCIHAVLIQDSNYPPIYTHDDTSNTTTQRQQKQLIRPRNGTLSVVPMQAKMQHSLLPIWTDIVNQLGENVSMTACYGAESFRNSKKLSGFHVSDPDNVIASVSHTASVSDTASPSAIGHSTVKRSKGRQSDRMQWNGQANDMFDSVHCVARFRSHYSRHHSQIAAVNAWEPFRTISQRTFGTESQPPPNPDTKCATESPPPPTSLLAKLTRSYRDAIQFIRNSHSDYAESPGTHASRLASIAFRFSTFVFFVFFVFS
jgi:hypothetical protein